MRRAHHPPSAAFRPASAVLPLLLCACAGAAQPAGSAAPRSSAAAQADSVRRSYTPADVSFMTRMITHHAQAIEMARLAPTHGASPSLGILAERIINAQQDEIATMRQWLEDRSLPVPDPTAAMHEHAGHSELMPGMLTAEQMRQLDVARGPKFDRLFLTLMIQHHEGALTMVRELFSSAGAAQEGTIFKFASDVSADQTTEVARMRRMLAAMPPETRSAR